MKISHVLIIVFLCSLLVGNMPAFAEGKIEQKAVLVTGASSGIGLRITETLARNGFYVYAGGRKTEDLERLDAMRNVSSVKLDVTVQKDIDTALHFIKSEGRGLWGIVNNAGVLVLSPLASGADANVRFTFDVNVFGPVRVNKAFLPLIMESKGRTTIIGSINGFNAAGGDSGYSASKFAVEGYVDSLAIELKNSGVHVSVVEPGTYKSEIRGKMVAQLIASADAGEIELDDKKRGQLIRDKFGNDELPEPDDVAKAVLHVMSNDMPKRRYLVTPNEEQARLTIRAAFQRMLELNDRQQYSYDRGQLIALMDELLEIQEPQRD